MGLAPGTAGSCESGLQLWAPPFADPGGLGSPLGTGSFWVTGSINFCQFRNNFLARLASSSLDVFFLTSLISLPSLVSYKDRQGVLSFQAKFSRNVSAL